MQKTLEVDAEEYYRSEIARLRQEIQQKEQTASSRNIGMCFIVFSDCRYAYRALDQKWLKSEIEKKVGI
jgi:hypothetical protein